MHRTIFDTPGTHTVLRMLYLAFLKVRGWRVEGALPPEGTRSKVRQWKSGFYYIATGAGVPIVLTYLNFGGKRLGVGPVFQPTGDIQADMQSIQAFYQPFQGRNPDQF